MAKHIDKKEYEHIINDPSAVYSKPEEVAHDERLSLEQKISILKQWAFDAREIEVAQEENMIGPASHLRQILLVLNKLEEGNGYTNG